MNPFLLVTWFLDDGSVREDYYAGRIATQSFTKEENELLCNYLNKWGITAKVVVHNFSKNQYGISLPAHTFRDFTKIIEPVVKNEIPDMIYKLNESRKKTP